MRAFMGSPGPVINLSKTDWVTRALGLFQNLHGLLLYAWGLYHCPPLFLHSDRQESSKLAEYYKSNEPNTISPRSRHSRNNTTTTNPHFCYDNDNDSPPLFLSLPPSYTPHTLSILFSSKHVDSVSLSFSFSLTHSSTLLSGRPNYIIYILVHDYCYTCMYKGL